MPFLSTLDFISFHEFDGPTSEQILGRFLGALLRQPRSQTKPERPTALLLERAAVLFLRSRLRDRSLCHRRGLPYTTLTLCVFFPNFRSDHLLSGSGNRHESDPSVFAAEQPNNARVSLPSTCLTPECESPDNRCGQEYGFCESSFLRSVTEGSGRRAFRVVAERIDLFPYDLLISLRIAANV